MAVKSVDTGVYAVVAEFKNQAPILMETEGDSSSFGKAQERMQAMAQRPDVIRVCVVRLEPAGVWAGNKSALRAMEDMQK